MTNFGPRFLSVIPVVARGAPTGDAASLWCRLSCSRRYSELVSVDILEMECLMPLAVLSASLAPTLAVWRLWRLAGGVGGSWRRGESSGL